MLIEEKMIESGDTIHKERKTRAKVWHKAVESYCENQRTRERGRKEIEKKEKEREMSSSQEDCEAGKEEGKDEYFGEE